MDTNENDRWIRAGHTMFSEFMHRVEKIDRIGVKGMNESTDEHRVTLIDKRKVYATLEEIADLYLDADKKLVLDFTESKAVTVFHTPSAQHPMEYIGFRWSFYKTPSRLVASQDFFYLETMKPFVDVYGRRGWAKLVMKARGKNNAALLNHYVKLARVTAYAGRKTKHSNKKLQQQLLDEKRCGACSNPMPKWSCRAKCHFCKSYVCKRCCEIVSQNYLFDGEAALNSCMLCAETNGSRIASLMDDGDDDDDDDDKDHNSPHSWITDNDSADTEIDTLSSSSSSVVSKDDYHHYHHQQHHGRFKTPRSMSMPSAIRPPLPPQLLDLGLDETVLRSHKTTPKEAPPSLSAPAAPPSDHRGVHVHYHARHSHPRKASSNHKHDHEHHKIHQRRRHIERSHGAAAAACSSSRAQHQQQQRSSGDAHLSRPRSAMSARAVVATDLSYLSAFKV